MDFDSVQPLLLATVVGVALALSAATLTTAVSASVEGTGQSPTPLIGQPAGEGSGDQDSTDAGTFGTGSATRSPIDFTACIEFLQRPFVVLGIAALFVGGLALVARLYSYAAAGLVGVGATPPVLVTYFALTNCGRSIAGTSEGGMGSITKGLGRGAGSASPVPPWMLFVVVLGVAGVGATAVLWAASGDDEFEVPTETEEGDGDVGEVARVAGEAADQIESDADVDNEVYRAWVEMTAHLDVDHPDATSPREFAEAAIGAGMDEDDIVELRRLFEEVRYGGEAPSAEREDRAVGVLRTIEAEYGDVDDTGSGRDEQR